MIKAEELRIPNYILWEGKLSTVEESFRDLDRMVDYCNNDFVEGVPLTTVWVKSMGLKEVRKDTFEITEDDEHNSTIIIKWSVKHECFTIVVTGFLYAFDYVHQLQNFYNGLTQKELFKR